MANLFSLEGKTAVVTGATRGIGQAMAIGLAEAGADLVLVQRDISNTMTAGQARSLGRSVTLIEADLSSASAVAELTPKLTSTNASILLNCAGIQRRHPSAKFPDDDWNLVLQTNLSTVFTLSRELGGHWIEKGIKGRIINVASILSFQGGVTVPAYVAAKHGVTGLTRALSNEWAGKGIGVNAVAPGYIATDMNEALIADPVRSRQISERIPAGRWGNPEDFKGVVVFLASEKASGYVSGETIVVDGGWMGR